MLEVPVLFNFSKKLVFHEDALQDDIDAVVRRLQQLGRDIAAHHINYNKGDPILPQRVRHVPRSFSWVGHRLVRECYIDRCSHPAAALYLFLVTVSDAKGMSYYGEETIMQRLSMDMATFKKARNNLIQADLIAWKTPLYQVLPLENRSPSKRPSVDGLLSLGQILRQAGGGHDRL